jgi:aminoglycoside phosphotransferase (APT) family kinase protein
LLSTRVRQHTDKTVFVGNLFYSILQIMKGVKSVTDFRVLPPRERLEVLLETLEPGSQLSRTSLFPKSFSNATHLIEATTRTGTPFNLVLRQYNPANEDPVRKALREFNALEALQTSNVPTAKPLLLDETGTQLGAPSIVTSFVIGKQFIGLDDP